MKAKRHRNGRTPGQDPYVNYHLMRTEVVNDLEIKALAVNCSTRSDFLA
jgi:hypothetical protein